MTLNIPKILVILLTVMSGLSQANTLTTQEISAIAKSAFIWGYPIVDNYSVLYEQALDPKSPNYKAPLNQISHARNIATPQDRAFVAPNVDTPYSYAWLDLSSEPIVLTLPKVNDGRYVAIQLIDSYTYIVDYVKPNKNGGNSNYLIAGPNWNGKKPGGVEKIIKTDTNIVLALYRTELLNAQDINQVHTLQDQYLVRTLSDYEHKQSLGKLSLPPLVRPTDLRKDPTNLEFFTVLNWMLASMPALPSEKELREQFAAIGIRPGEKFPEPNADTKVAIIQGMQAALQEMQIRAKNVKSSAELFGTREFLGDDYITRAVAAMIGIYGNAAQEFLGVGYPADSTGKAFNGNSDYIIHFKKNQLPPVNGFWSITVYDKDRFLYANQLNRHKLSSHMLSQFKRDSEDGITFYLQHKSPGVNKETNWLPTPEGPFILTFRTYLPKPAIRDGKWQAPPVIKTN